MAVRSLHTVKSIQLMVHISNHSLPRRQFPAFCQLLNRMDHQDLFPHLAVQCLDSLHRSFGRRMLLSKILEYNNSNPVLVSFFLRYRFRKFLSSFLPYLQNGLIQLFHVNPPLRFRIQQKIPLQLVEHKETILQYIPIHAHFIAQSFHIPFILCFL